MPESARILIVDDSRIFRTTLQEALSGAEDVVVAGSVFSGEKALEFIRVAPPDIVTLDVEMQGMDGLQTLEGIQRVNGQHAAGREIGVIMVSAFTQRGADVTVRALQAGAFDFVTKPTGPDVDENLALLRQQLLAKVRLFLTRRRLASRTADSERTISPARPVARSARTVQAVLIAASTGGPRALEKLLPDLCARVDLPILLVQHMPAGFTRSLAEHLSRQTSRTVVEAVDADVVRPHTVYVAPGGKHLFLRSRPGGQLLTGINEQPPENGCRPSADVLFRSAAAVLGAEAIAIVLTGMDCDGTAGLRPLKRAGGYVLVQDEATSVVWGMPGNVVRAGLADEVLPLDRIAEAAQSLIGERGGK
jgi:two-component system chemotaxis response regulator CheB